MFKVKIYANTPKASAFHDIQRMNQENSVSILGCGWLGFPLAQQLVQSAYRVNGSSTREEKLVQFSGGGIQPFLIRLDQRETLANFQEFADSEILIIAVPPGSSPEKKEAYLQFFQSLSDLLSANQQVRQLIYISSTSVYGEPNSLVDEASVLEPIETNGKLLAEVEQVLQTLHLPTCIIRAGGLIGPGRNPGRFFAGRQNIPNGQAPVNLIHQADVIQIILHAIAVRYQGIINACAPSHPSRSEFYSLAAQQAGLASPSFIQEKGQWKQVEPKYLQQVEFKFNYPNLLDPALFQSF